MDEKKELSRKKRIAVIIAFFIAVLLLVFLTTPFKLMIASIFGIETGDIKRNYIFFTVDLLINENNSLIPTLLVIFSPMILSMLLIETASLSVKLFNTFSLRISNLIFRLANITYIMLFTLFFALNTIFMFDEKSETLKLISVLEFSFEKKMILIFICVLIPFTYISFALNRLKTYISENE